MGTFFSIFAVMQIGTTIMEISMALPQKVFSNIPSGYTTWNIYPKDILYPSLEVQVWLYS